MELENVSGPFHLVRAQLWPEIYNLTIIHNRKHARDFLFPQGAETFELNFALAPVQDGVELRAESMWSRSLE